MQAVQYQSQCEYWYLHYQTWLTQWLIKRVNCYARAEDLCHDTFAKLLQKRSFIELNTPKAYLTKIAHGLMVDECRRRDLEQAFFQQVHHQSAEQTSLSLEAQHILLETLLHIDQLLDGLPAKVRHIFLLYRLDGVKQVTIAAELRISLSSVEKYIRQALLHCYKAQYA